MDIEAIKKRIAEIRALANEILASEEARPFHCYQSNTFVTCMIDSDGDQWFEVSIDECSPNNHEAQTFLAEKLREKGVTEPLEISSEW